MPQARTRPGRKRRVSERPWTVTTIRMDAELFGEWQDALDWLTGRDGRPMTQREFVEVAVRRELARRRKQENRKGAADARSQDS